MSPSHLNLVSEITSPVILKRSEQIERQKLKELFKSKKKTKCKEARYFDSIRKRLQNMCSNIELELG